MSLRLGPRSTPEGSDSFVAPGKRPQVGGVYWHRASGHSASACICVRVQMRVRTSGKGVQSPAGVMVVVSAALDQGGQRLQSKNFPVRKPAQQLQSHWVLPYLGLWVLGWFKRVKSRTAGLRYRGPLLLRPIPESAKAPGKENVSTVVPKWETLKEPCGGCGPLRALAKQSFLLDVESFPFKQETAPGSSSGRQQSSKVSPRSTSSKELLKSLWA